MGPYQQRADEVREGGGIDGRVDVVEEVGKREGRRKEEEDRDGMEWVACQAGIRSSGDASGQIKCFKQSEDTFRISWGQQVEDNSSTDSISIQISWPDHDGCVSRTLMYNTKNGDL